MQLCHVLLSLIQWQSTCYWFFHFFGKWQRDELWTFFLANLANFSCCTPLHANFAYFVLYDFRTGSFENIVKRSKLMAEKLKNIQKAISWLVMSSFKTLAKMAVLKWRGFCQFDLWDLEKNPQTGNFGGLFLDFFKGLGHIEQKPFSFQSLERFEC